MALLLSGAFVMARARASVGVPEAVCLALALSQPFFEAHKPMHFLRAAYRSTNDTTKEQLAAAQDLRKERDLLWYRDGPDVSVAVTRDARGGTTLRINGKPDASDPGEAVGQALDGSNPGDLQTQLMVGHLPMLLHENPKEVLMIGFGAGGSIDAALHHDLEKIDVAEISSTVLAGARAGFKDIYPRAFQDPRVTVHLVDGRLLIRSWPGKVDVIISEPTNLFVQGVSNLYTEEFFDACRDRLRPGGMLVIWVQGYELDDESIRRVVRTLSKSFPYVSLEFYGDLIFLASDRPNTFDFRRLRKRLARPGVAEGLMRAQLPPMPETLIERHIANEETLKEWAGHGPLLSDDHPFLEFAAARDRFLLDYDLIERTFQAVYQLPSFGGALPAKNLTVPDKGGGQIFPAALLRFTRSAVGEFTIERHLEEDPKTGETGNRPVVSAVWESRSKRGRVRVEAYSQDDLPDPGRKHRQLRDLARDLGLPSAPSGRGRISSHEAMWTLFEGGPDHSRSALFSWICPRNQRTHLLQVFAEQSGDDRNILQTVLPHIACFHHLRGQARAMRFEPFKGGSLKP